MKNSIKILLKLFLTLLALYTLLRALFACLNFNTLEAGDATWLKVFLYGVIIDISSVVYINFLFILFYFFLFPFLPGKLKIPVLLSLFLIMNLPFIALNTIDLFYYRFNNRRSTTDIFYSLPASIQSFGSLFTRYWWVLLFFIIISVLFFVIVKRLVNPWRNNIYPGWKTWLPVSVFITSIFVLFARGFGNRPLSPASPLLYFDPVFQPVINNSSLNMVFAVLKTRTRLQRQTYYDPTELNKFFPLTKQFEQVDSFNKKNVVLFVLESFSEQNFVPGSLKANMPFFDSLRKQSTVMTRTYQNGYESVKGLVAILGSIPPFLNEPLFVSNYSNTRFDGIGSLLKEQGYHTSFFLGAEYDHFNFGKLCKMVGIDNYYSKERMRDKDKSRDDNTWGIYDEYFFDFFGQTMDSIRQPFFSVLYNISSHPPFNIPPERKKQFDSGNAQFNAMSYVDFCFQELFGQIRTKDWYDNTIFIFTADHTLNAAPENPEWRYYKNLHIPFFVYDPSNAGGGEISAVTQQLDVVPTVLDMLNYEKPFMSFGNSVFREGHQFSISNINEVFQLIDTTGITGFDAGSGKVVYCYDWNADPALRLNKKDSCGRPASVWLTKAVVQQFTNSLVENSFR